MTMVMALLVTGCNGFTLSLPNEEYDQENTELAYLKIFPAEAEIKVNQSKAFEVKAYNSDSKLIAMDVSKIKWSARWTTCISCIEWTLTPTQGSATTIFTPTNPEKTGKYIVFANYGGTEGKWADADVYVN
ncbi:MAG: hypothetical protein PHS21_07970 [Atribacterota bacterium]|nr:hypothetical protein [Atribacterota bacterium]